MVSKTEKQQATEFLFLLDKLPSNDRVIWFETWISPGVENSETQREHVLDRMRAEIEKGKCNINENQESLSL